MESAARESRAVAITRNDNDALPERAVVASSASAALKPAKSAPATAARRTQTSEQGPSAEPKRRGGEPLAIQPPIVAANPAPRPAAQSPQAASRDESATWNGDEERPLLAKLKQVPSWFLPENDRVFGDLPRPPMPVGESLRSAM
jgi:hypothetical protein